MTVPLTAEQVGQVVTFIAPGYLARSTFGASFPRPETPDYATLISSVVLSLPLVAIADALVHPLGLQSTTPTDLAYVALLLMLSVILGYGLGVLRSTYIGRMLAGRAGFESQADRSIYAQTILSLPPEAAVTRPERWQKSLRFTSGRPVQTHWRDSRIVLDECKMVDSLQGDVAKR